MSERAEQQVQKFLSEFWFLDRFECGSDLSEEIGWGYEDLGEFRRLGYQSGEKFCNVFLLRG